MDATTNRTHFNADLITFPNRWSLNAFAMVIPNDYHFWTGGFWDEFTGTWRWASTSAASNDPINVNMFCTAPPFVPATGVATFVYYQGGCLRQTVDPDERHYFALVSNNYTVPKL